MVSGNFVGVMSAHLANRPDSAAREAAPTNVCVGEGSVVVVDFGDEEEVVDIDQLRHSPLVEALLGKKPGDEFSFKQVCSDVTGNFFKVEGKILSIV